MKPLPSFEGRRVLTEHSDIKELEPNNRRFSFNTRTAELKTTQNPCSLFKQNPSNQMLNKNQVKFTPGLHTKLCLGTHLDFLFLDHLYIRNPTANITTLCRSL